jgi:hypothetical protein
MPVGHHEILDGLVNRRATAGWNPLSARTYQRAEGGAQRFLRQPVQRSTVLCHWLIWDFPARVESLVVIGSAPTAFSLFMPTPVEGVKLIGQYYRGEGGPTYGKMKQIIGTMVIDQRFATEESSGRATRQASIRRRSESTRLPL